MPFLYRIIMTANAVELATSTMSQDTRKHNIRLSKVSKWGYTNLIHIILKPSTPNAETTAENDVYPYDWIVFERALFAPATK